MKGLLSIIGLIVSLSCTEKKAGVTYSRVEPRNQMLELYSDILIELVTERFYYLYLGNEELEGLSKERIQVLRGIVEPDTSKWRSICLENELLYGPWRLGRSEDQEDSLNISPILKDFMKITMDDVEQLFDSLKAPQSMFQAEDFQPVAFKVEPVRDSRDCEIGSISFSKVYFANPTSQGILYYEFVCGGKCGKGEFLVVEKVTDKWTIKKMDRIWSM